MSATTAPIPTVAEVIAAVHPNYVLLPRLTPESTAYPDRDAAIVAGWVPIPPDKTILWIGDYRLMCADITSEERGGGTRWVNEGFALKLQHRGGQIEPYRFAESVEVETHDNPHPGVNLALRELFRASDVRDAIKAARWFVAGRETPPPQPEQPLLFVTDLGPHHRLPMDSPEAQAILALFERQGGGLRGTEEYNALLVSPDGLILWAAIGWEDEDREYAEYVAGPARLTEFRQQSWIPLDIAAFKRLRTQLDYPAQALARAWGYHREYIGRVERDDAPYRAAFYDALLGYALRQGNIGEESSERN